MDVDYLAMKNAEKQVASYIEEADGLMRLRAESLDCRNCEACLQMGIDAFHWIIRADRVIRAAEHRAGAECDDKLDAIIRRLCKSWLAPAELANMWIAAQQQRGCDLDNLAEFRNCIAEMQAIVEFDEKGDDPMPPAIVDLSELAAREHRNGETAEFI